MSQSLTTAVEEKYGHDMRDSQAKHSSSAQEEVTDSDSASESEDEGLLATQEVDNEISATLSAIRSRDPRVYDKSYQFYNQRRADDSGSLDNTRKAKPTTLQDYHRQNLLDNGTEVEQDRPSPASPADERDSFRQDLIQQMHQAVGDEDKSNDSESEKEFLRAKRKPEQAEVSEKRDLPSITAADTDPDAFLNTLMASRAWVPHDRADLHPFESDDEDEERRADEFEEAYNMRFEDPARANEKLISHSRNAAAEYSVRREDSKGRKRAREADKLRKEEARQQKEAEKARLRNLRVEQAHEKLKQFKEAAGLKSKDLSVEEWSRFLNAGFDEEKWDQEMQTRFGAQYYEGERDDDDDGDVENGLMEGSNRSKRSTKPKWADDIDIKDIVPGFQDADDAHFSLSDLDSNQDAHQMEADSEPIDGFTQPKSARSRKKMNATDRKKRARKEHRKIEEMVDSRLPLDTATAQNSSNAPSGPFRYRETSPTSFGLTTRDILFAEDKSLNQHHGLKRLASFRDRARKDKDKHKLDKKRLRKWRKETFGDRKPPADTS